jgi:hypothetical protein
MHILSNHIANRDTAMRSARLNLALLQFAKRSARSSF